MTTSADVEIRPVTLDDLEVLIDIYVDTAIHHATIDPEWFHIPARDDIAARLRQRVDGRGETSEFVGRSLTTAWSARPRSTSRIRRIRAR